MVRNRSRARDCPHCHSLIPSDSGFAFDDNLNMICKACGNKVFSPTGRIFDSWAVICPKCKKKHVFGTRFWDFNNDTKCPTFIVNDNPINKGKWLTFSHSGKTCIMRVIDGKAIFLLDDDKSETKDLPTVDSSGNLVIRV